MSFFRSLRFALPLVLLILFCSLASAQNFSASPTVSMHQLRIPENARTAFHQGLQRFEKRDFAGSVPFFSKAINKFPDFYEAYYQLGLAQVHLNQNDDAVRSFQAAIHLSGGHYSLAEFAYALLLCNRGELPEAERLVRHGLAQSPDMPDGYIVLGVVLLHSNRLDEAEHYAREALKHSEQAFNAYLLLADVHDYRKDYSAEIRDLDHFLAVEPTGPRADHARHWRELAQQHVSYHSASPLG
jgi:tetratricopeptide (TPR) repeat protein